MAAQSRLEWGEEDGVEICLGAEQEPCREIGYGGRGRIEDGYAFEVKQPL